MNNPAPTSSQSMTTTRKVAIAMAVVGGLAPLIRQLQANGEVSAFVIVDMAVNAAIWFGLVMLVGWVVGKLRRKPAPTASSGQITARSASVPGSESADASTRAPVAPVAPAGWHPDPFGRFESRYWDGRWTSHVSSNGRTYQDAPE